MNEPVYITYHKFADGLPTAVQLIGKRYREDLILNAMQAIEDRLGTLYPRLWSDQI